MSLTHRLIRVFVSSTFQDMRAERDELIKQVFPQLRKLCEARGVTWAEVDLRWGVSDEQKAEGQVLPICLDEIRRCRPYFIGLLGERYGWTLDDIDTDILAREPWLSAYRGRSVTEIEMVCGVLGAPGMAEHAFFYLRDPEAAAYLDPPLTPVTSKDAVRLAALKDRIRDSGLPIREGFHSARDLGAEVLADFTALIDRLFPQSSAPDPLDAEAALHDAFAASRAQAYVGRESDYARLDAHVDGDGPPLAVLGPSGLGKSALLANWTLRRRAAHRDQSVIAHHLGASPASADWAALARRLIGELNRRLGLSVAIPDAPDALRAALSEALRKAGSAHRVVLVLDGLDQLEDRNQAPDLAWLPRDLPRGVRLIVSTLPGRALDEIHRRGWPILDVAPLTISQREQLIAGYLSLFAKTLAQAQVQALAAAPLAGNPLFLTSVLEELRVCGVHETLDSQIGNYLGAPTLADLFQRILARYEADYDRDRPGLVREAFSVIWAARSGLSQAELLDVLGDGAGPLPGAVWSPLYLAAERGLVSHSGLLGFFHAYLRSAVEARYLPALPQRQAEHLKLADYFAARDLGPRKLAELPWHLTRAKAWDRLAEVLADLPFLRAAWDLNAYDVRGYWSAVKEHQPDAPLKAYQPVFDDPTRFADYLYLVSLLLLRLDYPRQSLALQNGVLDLLERTGFGHTPRIISLLLEIAANHRALGEPETALQIIRRAVALGRGGGESSALAGAVANEAVALLERGDLLAAAPLFEEAAALARRLGEQALLAEILLDQSILVSKQDPARGLAVLEELEQLVRALGDHDTLAACLGNQGHALARLGRLDAALERFRAQARVAREIGASPALAMALRGEGLVFASRHADEEALARLAEAEAIRRRLDDKKGLADLLLLQASIALADNGDRIGGLQRMEEYAQLCRAVGDDAGLARGMDLQSSLLVALERPVEAIQSLKSAEDVFHSLGDIEGEARAIFNQARIRGLMLKMPAAAMPGMRRAQALAEANGLSALAQELKQAADGFGGRSD